MNEPVALDPRFQPITAKDIFGNAEKIFNELFSRFIVEKASQLPGVPEKIEEQKTEVGKNLLWKYIPHILIGTILTVLIVRFK